ncbi:hypothetical protein GCM10010435_81470 [Winogradskya consettensis]|uniref:Uncharacterized protein n=1 Tax=Winogradskya consettensis TaxID=113560 RepID=A0A919SVV9_9ACTN|nr:hypothetical protein [Actinoplanes consettensis]GIM78959.1 hypothetical protein Aco04nite_63050 [Actinoplanes consettensis]
MDGFRPAAESEVVLAFLRGELESARFGDDVRRAVADAGGLHLVRDPDLDSTEQNHARERALATTRGWRDRELFEGFPATVDWYHGVLPPEVLSRVRYIDYSYWKELSRGSRRPTDVLATLRSGTLPTWVREIGTDWCFDFTADTVDDLIVMATPDLGELVLLEGHARMTGLFVAGLERRVPVRAYLGVSAAIKHWNCF